MGVTIRKFRSQLDQLTFSSWWRATLASARSVHPRLEREAILADAYRAESETRPAAAARWVWAIREVMKRRFDLLITPSEADLLRRWTKVLSQFSAHLQDRIMPALTVQRRKYIVDTARVLLCTIDSSSRMVQQLEYALVTEMVSLAIDTCIVDEAGCVLESSIPVLLHWKPANIVLVCNLSH